MDTDNKQNSSDQETQQAGQPKVKRNLKDSVFTHLFSDKAYVLQLYQALHPDDREATEDMIDLITLEPVLVDSMYNDLGFIMGDRMLILVEAQSTWSPNIIVRLIIYAAETYNNYIHDNGMDLYNARPVVLPEPELYVLYTGKQKINKGVITLSEEFFGGKQLDVDVRVHVLTDGKQGDIINQYVVFAEVLDEQVKLYGRTRKAVEETIRICKDRGALAKYLTAHEQEVIEMTMSIFDDEFIQKAHSDAMYQDGRKEGIKEGINEGISIGEARGHENGFSEATNTMTQKMIEEGLPEVTIARISGLSIDEVNALKASMV